MIQEKSPEGTRAIKAELEEKQRQEKIVSEATYLLVKANAL